jgi:4a-hydroxytetrahydrobiopterin dehydratase
VRELAFENQTELADFVLRIARYSDEVEHHADMDIREYRKLRLSITTHDRNALTERDIEWAKSVNEIIDSFRLG